jgi:hypothetical protein
LTTINSHGQREDAEEFDGSPATYSARPPPASSMVPDSRHDRSPTNSTTTFYFRFIERVGLEPTI